MKRFNFLTAKTYADESAPEAYRANWASIQRAIGGEHLAGNMIVIPPGNKGMQYHWEASQEEWLLVLEGTPTLRTPEGEQQLRAGDVTVFARSPDGAHQVINHSDSEARIVILSDVVRPEVIVYPDSNKVMITDPGLETLLRLDARVDYWEGEGR